MGLYRGVNRYSHLVTRPLKWRPWTHQLVTSCRNVCVECNSSDDIVYVPLPPNINLKHLNLKSEADRRKIYETWRVPFMDANQPATAEFYFPNQSNIVRCVSCGVEMCWWTEGDVALKEHRCWSPSCSFAKGLWVGNISIPSNGQPEKSSQQPTWSRDVCGPHFELRPNSLPERSKYYYLYFLFWYVCALLLRTNFQCSFTATSPRTFKHALRQNNCSQLDAPSTLNSEDSPPEWSLFPPGLLRPNKTLTI